MAHSRSGSGSPGRRLTFAALRRLPPRRPPCSARLSRSRSRGSRPADRGAGRRRARPPDRRGCSAGRPAEAARRLSSPARLARQSRASTSTSTTRRCATAPIREAILRALDRAASPSRPLRRSRCLASPLLAITPTAGRRHDPAAARPTCWLAAGRPPGPDGVRARERAPPRAPPPHDRRSSRAGALAEADPASALAARRRGGRRSRPLALLAAAGPPPGSGATSTWRSTPTSTASTAWPSWPTATPAAAVPTSARLPGAATTTRACAAPRSTASSPRWPRSRSSGPAATTLLGQVEDASSGPQFPRLRGAPAPSLPPSRPSWPCTRRRRSPKTRTPI